VPEASSAPLPASICVFCGARFGSDPRARELAANLGELLAREGVTLVYGGGGVGLMGVMANAALAAGGNVVGVIPRFLLKREAGHPALTQTLVVETMHERKLEMFERSDAIVVLPGGIGTLEEVIELLSWRRLDLHAKPIVFYNPDGFWDGLFAFFRASVAQRLTPPEFLKAYSSVTRIADVIPMLRGASPEDFETDPRVARLT